MNILIVTTRFFPFGSATSGVVGNFAQALVDLGCKVKIIALTRFKEEDNENYWNGIPVHLEYVPSTITKEQANNEWKTHFLRTLHAISLKVLDKLFQIIHRNYRKYSINYSILKSYKKALGDESLDKYDICIATLMSIEAVLALKMMRNHKIKFGIYQLDPYWNNVELPSKYIEARKQLEYQLVMESDLCMTTPIIEVENTNIFPSIANKYLIVDFPCIKRPSFEVIDKEDNSIHCVFVGMLYTVIRPPEKVINIIAEIKSHNIFFDFFGDGQNLILQSKIYNNIKERIKLHGVVSSQEAECARIKADILLNIDNTSSALVPSKIFEYISTGKPIINFYFTKDSYTLRYFEKYPLCLNIYLFDQPDENAKLIELFIERNKHKRIDFETIKNIYFKNTPEFVGEQCVKWINSH